jgi:hypothetical protein
MRVSRRLYVAGPLPSTPNRAQNGEAKIAVPSQAFDGLVSIDPLGAGTGGTIDSLLEWSARD